MPVEIWRGIPSLPDYQASSGGTHLENQTSHLAILRHSIAAKNRTDLQRCPDTGRYHHTNERECIP